MENQNMRHYLTDWEGRRVPVSQEVYDAYWYYTNKEDYFMRLLKSERFRFDPNKRIALLLPGKEDSLDRLLDEGEEFALDQKSVEDTVVNSVLVQGLLENATREERKIAYLAFFVGATEEEASALLNLKRTTYQRKRDAMLSRWRNEFNDSS